MPAYNKPPDERKTRRFEAIYMALCALRAREIIKIVGAEQTIGYGEDLAFLQELAMIIDDRLRLELERQRAAEAQAALNSTALVYKALKNNLTTVQRVCWSSKQAEHTLLSKLAQEIGRALAEDARQRAKRSGATPFI